MKIEVKLPIYDGTPDDCMDWFITQEKNLRYMKVNSSDYLFYAAACTTGVAKDATTVFTRN